jgi:hypothetical protein
VPSYLDSVKRQITQEKRMLKEQEESRQAKPNMRELSPDEKEAMILGLKENLEKINLAYRQLPVAINTLTQKTKYIKFPLNSPLIRKEQFEKQMESIEKDIAKLSKKHVYVQL